MADLDLDLDAIEATVLASTIGDWCYVRLPGAERSPDVVLALVAELREARRESEERDARPEGISPENARGWLTERFEDCGPSENWNAVVRSLRAHAAKATEAPDADR